MRALLVVALLAAWVASGAEGRTGGSLAVEGKIVLPGGRRWRAPGPFRGRGRGLAGGCLKLGCKLVCVARARPPAPPAEGVRLPPETEVQVRLESGRVLVTYPADGGRFSVPAVPEGVHTLNVYAPGWFFPAVRGIEGGNGEG